MEKELFAVVAIYKSEAMNYLRDNNIAREDALIITTVEDFEKAKNRLIRDVKLISAPMGLSSNEDDLKKLLIRTKEEEVADLLTGDISEIKEATITVEGHAKADLPIVGGDSPSNEEEVKEIKTTKDEEVGSGLKELAKKEVKEPEVKAPEVKSVDNDEAKLKAMMNSGKKTVTRKKTTKK